MPKTVQIRDLDDDVYAALAVRAAEAEVSVPELLRREVKRIAMRPSLSSWLARTRTRHSEVLTGEVLATLDEWRGDWPDARH